MRIATLLLESFHSQVDLLQRVFVRGYFLLELDVEAIKFLLNLILNEEDSVDLLLDILDFGNFLVDLTLDDATDYI